MIEYLSGNGKYILSYNELRNQYIEFCQMQDDEFILKLPDVIHLACFICFLKEVPSCYCLSDTGIIHELVHLLKENGTTTSLRDIRALFEFQLKLA